MIAPLLGVAAAVAAEKGPDVLNCHDVVLGDDGLLVSWLQQSQSMAWRCRCSTRLGLE